MVEFTAIRDRGGPVVVVDVVLVDVVVTTCARVVVVRTCDDVVVSFAGERDDVTNVRTSTRSNTGLDHISRWVVVKVRWRAMVLEM